MGTTNMGNQLLSFDYLNPGSSISFNKLLLDLIPPGFYAGGEISIVTGKPVVAPFTAFIVTNNSADHTDPNVIGVRVQTMDPAGYTVASWSAALPYLVLRLNWASMTNNYADILAVNSAGVLDGDLVIGYVPDTNPLNISYKDATHPRSIVIRFADTIPLVEGIASAPTGGTGTNLSGANTVVNALNEIFSRIRDLSGAQNASLLKRHLDLGTGAGKINAQTFQIDTTFDFVGSGNDVAASDSVMTAMTKFYNALKDLTGVVDDSVGTRLMNWGLAGDQVNAAQMPANVATAFGAGGGVATPLVADTVQVVLQKIINSIANLSGAATSSVKKRHVDFIDIRAKDFTIGTVVSQALSALSSVTIAAGDALNTALEKILTGLADLATRVTAINDYGVATRNQLNGLPAYERSVKIGAIMMFDGSDWSDNAMPGWYACTAANNALDSRIPNLEGRFIQAVSPGTWTGLAGGRYSGSGQITLAKGHIPAHVHDMNHEHPYGARINNGGLGLGSSNERVRDSGTGPSSASNTGDGVADGLSGAPAALDLQGSLRQYALIFIKKMS